MSTADFWAGQFGDDYTDRNRVDWRKRIPFWQNVLTMTGARSVFEFGCNAGWNLSAIGATELPWTPVTYGVDINQQALMQAEMAGLNVRDAEEGELPFVQGHNVFDLVFTAGVLIHIAPEDIERTMRDLVEMSSRYVLAVEYPADQEEEIDYRGHAGKLWRRPFGKMYQDMGLKLVHVWDAGKGFDNCVAWLMEKP